MSTDLMTCDPATAKAGAELDALIAEKWMGWTPKMGPGGCAVREKGQLPGEFAYWFPSTNPAHAGEARRKAADWTLFRFREGIGCYIWDRVPGPAQHAACLFTETNGSEELAEALATCRAILAALKAAEAVETTADPPHSYRPFTTRDGSKACADCHAPPGNAVHQEAEPPPSGSFAAFAAQVSDAGLTARECTGAHWEIRKGRRRVDVWMSKEWGLQIREGGGYVLGSVREAIELAGVPI
jgi:hypothetical protein